MRSLLIIFCVVLIAAFFVVETEQTPQLSVPGGRPPMVGGNRCTFGPAFWCASPQNAQLCGQGAVDHCNRVGFSG
ncbi:hypothetical protein DAPPUDRAFT_321847 [Daphnia pulex]|uniref:Saposin A-type domain-containing protein n=1 Tax=Daphnia pulex TaxID=6669 RepID=E9GU33_DAPPU|nr:hypothetical protein DAPPUDRAFT_321847 [Daphnia pulex]|eukprot:EFX76967.1 hypothetical protein DAPPUDRAFT_321847 [Daphnia pulex]